MNGGAAWGPRRPQGRGSWVLTDSRIGCRHKELLIHLPQDYRRGVGICVVRGMGAPGGRGACCGRALAELLRRRHGGAHTHRGAQKHVQPAADMRPVQPAFEMRSCMFEHCRRSTGGGLSLLPSGGTTPRGPGRCRRCDRLGAAGRLVGIAAVARALTPCCSGSLGLPAFTPVVAKQLRRH